MSVVVARGTERESERVRVFFLKNVFTSSPAFEKITSRQVHFIINTIIIIIIRLADKYVQQLRETGDFFIDEEFIY